MSRHFLKAAILAKLETVYGQDATPTGSANAFLVYGMSIDPLNAQMVDREMVRPHFGSFEKLPGTTHIKVGFSVEFAGSGTAATAPAWSPLLQACGMTETVGASWVEWNPNTDNDSAKSLTIYYHLDGVLHKLLGARGTVKPSLKVNGRPMLVFEFIGIDGGVTAVNNPAVTLSAFKKPLIVTDTNTTDVMVGATFATGALSGGTSYITGGIEFDLKNKVAHKPRLGGESVMITGREVTGKVAMELTAAQYVTFHGYAKNGDALSVGIEHGTTSGHKVGLFSPLCQFLNPSYEDQDGIVMASFDLSSIPSAGNDELKIYSK